MPRGDPDVIFSYSSGLLALAYYGVSVLGALTGIGIMEQRRLSRNAVNKRVLEVVSACSMGGASLWGMHVICTLAIRLTNPLTMEPYPVQLLWEYLILALVAPIVFLVLAVELASGDKFFGKSVHERVEMMAKEMKGLSMAKMRMGGRQLIMLRALVSSPGRLLGAGVTMGIGVFAMQYLIILSMKVSCERLTRYPYVALAAGVSLVVCVLFLWTLFRLLTWKPKLEWLRVLCAFVFGGIALSIHFVTVKSMDWMTFVHGEPRIEVAENRTEVAVLVLPVIFIWCCSCFVLIIADLRRGLVDYKADVDKIFKSLRPVLADAKERGVLSQGPSSPSASHADKSTAGRPSIAAPRADAARLETLLLDMARILSRHATQEQDRSYHASAQSASGRDGVGSPSISRQSTAGQGGLPVFTIGTGSQPRISVAGSSIAEEPTGVGAEAQPNVIIAMAQQASSFSSGTGTNTSLSPTTPKLVMVRAGSVRGSTKVMPTAEPAAAPPQPVPRGSVGGFANPKLEPIQKS